MKKITGLVLWLCPAVSLPFLVAFSEKTAINPAFILLFSLLIVYFLCFSIFYPLSKEPLGAGAVYGGILICAGYGLILGQNNDEFRLAGLLYSSMFGSVIGIFSGCFLADKLADLTEGLGFAFLGAVASAIGFMLPGYSIWYLTFLAMLFLSAFVVSEFIRVEFPKLCEYTE